MNFIRPAKTLFFSLLANKNRTFIVIKIKEITKCIGMNRDRNVDDRDMFKRLHVCKNCH